MKRLFDSAADSGSQKGYTLLQLIGLMVAIAIVATVALQVVQTSLSKSRYENAKAEMRRIEAALRGSPGVAGECGYVGDVGSLPTSLEDLIRKPASVCSRWNGPYLDVSRNPENPLDPITDPWGNRYVLDNNNLYVASEGPGGVDTLLIHNFASSYNEILNNGMTITFRSSDVTPQIRSGCQIRTFKQISSNRWRADSLTQCPGDVFYIRNGEKHFLADEGESPLQQQLGIIEFVGNSAAVSGPENNNLEFAIEVTGEVPMQISQLRIDWHNQGNCWGQLVPELSRISVDDQIVWTGDTGRLKSGQLITFPEDDPMVLEPGEHTLAELTFYSKDGYAVNMNGTEFLFRFYPLNATQRTVRFATSGYCRPGIIQYVSGSLISNGEALGAAPVEAPVLTDRAILAGGEVSFAGNHHGISGDMHSNGDFRISGNTQSQFCGVVSAGGQFRYNGPPSGPDLCGNSSDDFVEPVEIPERGSPWTVNQFTETRYGDVTLSGNRSYDNAVIRIRNGNLTIDDVTITGNVTFRVEGGLTIDGDLTLGSSPDSTVRIITDGSVTTGSDNEHTINAGIYSAQHLHISSTGHHFRKLVWVNGSAQISGNSNVFDRGLWAGNIQISGNSQQIHGLLWSAGAIQISGNSQVITGAMIAQNDIAVTGGSLQLTYDENQAKLPNEDAGSEIISDVELTLENPGDTPVYTNAVTIKWGKSGTYLEELMLLGNTYYDEPNNRLASGSRIQFSEHLIFNPGEYTQNKLHDFYSRQSGGSVADMGGTQVTLEFHGINGRIYPVTFTIP